MERQSFLFAEPDLNIISDEVAKSEINILAWNIQSPSLERAKSQLDWIINCKANILILTETIISEGSFYIISKLESYGFRVFYSKPIEDKYFTTICTKGICAEESNFKIDIYPARIKYLILDTLIGKINLIGMYAPTSWALIKDEEKKIRNLFHNQVISTLKAQGDLGNLILGGDLNIIDPYKLTYPKQGFEDHSFYTGLQELGFSDSFRILHPNEVVFSWYNNNREGFRFDYFFSSNNIQKYIKDCSYDHQVRFQKKSDHSAMFLRIGLNNNS